MDSMRGSMIKQPATRNIPESGSMIMRQDGSRNMSDTLRPAMLLRQTAAPRGGILPEPGYTLAGHDHFQKGAEQFQFDDLYIEGERISSGAYGTVYKCCHRSDPSKKYAVKILERARLKQKENMAVFREMSILHELRSLDHVVSLIDFFQDKSHLYMVQELAEGGDVFDRLSRRQYYTEKDARDLAYILLKTVGALHRVPIVHRDLKPDNLLLRYANDDTSIMLADFGFARKIEEGEWCHTRCGTPAFVAPEILVGQPYSFSVDLWSIGCLLYMLIGGYPPFQGNNHREIFCKIRAGDFVFHESVFQNVSVAVKNLIAHLLTVNPLNRCSAEQALASDWFLRETPERLLKNDLSGRTLPVMNEAQKKWKAAKTAIVWAAAQPFWKPDNVTFSLQVNAWDNAVIDQKLLSDPTEPNVVTPSKPATCRDALIRMESSRAPKTPMRGVVIHCVKFADVYNLLKPIRSGSSAVVWECQHIVSKEKFAVKVIDRKGLKPSDDENILTEVAMMQSLSGSKYCVQLLDFYEEPEAFYLVMEYMKGGDVFDRIVRLKTYMERDARHLAKILLKAVSAMHRAGIAHRDLKPQNLLLVSSENHAVVKVGDFGWSRRVHTPSSLTSRVGTPTYVAPEILKNVPHDERVDLWSVGVVIFVLLVGYPPFLEDDQAIMFDKIRRGEWLFVEDDWKQISPEARELIRGLLKVDPKERLTAEEALKSAWIKTEASSLSVVSLGDSVTSIRRQRNRLRALAATVIFMNNMNTTGTTSQTQGMDIVEEEENEDFSLAESFTSSATFSVDSMDEDL